MSSSNMTSNMKAIVISNFGPVENLVIKDVPKPSATVPGTALSVPISGIECVGVVEECPGGELAEGTPVASMMGGLGRTIPGSYAEYTVANVNNIVALGVPGEELPVTWAEAAALPESYATAWTCLFRNLDFAKGQNLLIRGATSSFGRAAVGLAVEAGAIVTATSRTEAKFPVLKELGVADAVLEGPNLGQRLRDSGKPAKFDRVLELSSNLYSSSTEMAVFVWQVGLAAWIRSKVQLAPMRTEVLTLFCKWPVGFTSASLAALSFGSEEFPVSDVPLRTIMQKVADGKIHAKPWKVFKFEEIHAAHEAMETGEAEGKMVVTVGQQ
ncbi:hypothetical protein ACCO45_002565 [Purpureocillium lilacinum]|uniref:Uncharacterized protein n=1 Tax=Purpureocillium lilacinum TaxID=33203 RepID=A0ACC4EC79_PURLI